MRPQNSGTPESVPLQHQEAAHDQRLHEAAQRLAHAITRAVYGPAALDQHTHATDAGTPGQAETPSTQARQETDHDD